MVMRALRQGVFGGFLKYVLMSLLALSVLGLVFMDVQGVMQGGVGGTDVARVGSESIGMREFDKFARMSLGRFNMTPEEAYNKNPKVMDEILGTEIRSRFVMLEAESMGISVGQKKLQEELIVRIKPMQNEGETLQQTLDRVLRSQGVRESDFVKNYNREIIGDTLLDTAQDGFGAINSYMARDLFMLQNHTRDIEFISFAQDEIKTIEAPDEERLKRLYESFKNTQFKIPEMRVLEVAHIDDTKLKDTIDVSEETLRKHYEERIEEYSVGEQRVLEQIVAPNPDKAQLILKLARDEKVPLRDAMERVLGKNEGTYVPAAPFGDDMLIGEIKDAVTKAKSGEFVGPIETVMGQHVISVGEIIAPRTMSFDEVKDALRREMEQIALADTIYDLSSQLDDIIAGGNSLEDAGQAVPLNITTLPAMSALGLDKDKKDVFESMSDHDKTDKAILLEEGFAIQEGEISRVFELPSGRFAVLRVKETIEATFKPYEDVKKTLADDFIRDQQRVETFRKISEFVAAVKAGKKSFEDIARETGKKIEKREGLTLGGSLPAPLNDNQRAMIFESYVGDLLTLPVEGGAAIARIKAANMPKIDEQAEQSVKRIEAELSKEVKDEVFNYYVQRIGRKHPAVVNHQLLEQVYGQKAATEPQP